MKATTFTIIAAATTFASSAAHADVVDMKFTGTGAGSGVQIHIGESDSMNVFAGELKHEITNATGIDSYLNGEHRTFCADITERVSSQFTQYHTTELENIPVTESNAAPMSNTQADAIRSLYSTNANTLRAGDLSNAFAAAMQITIWEIVADFDGTEASINLNAGNLSVTGRNGDDLSESIVDHFDNIKLQLMAGFDRQQLDQVIGVARPGAQDQLITIPAPGAFALLTAGGLLVSRRRRS